MKSAKPFLVVLAITLLAGVLSAQPPTENIDPSGGGIGGSGCYVCSMVQSGPTISMSCMTPASGSQGMQYCYIDSGADGSYCFTGGNACCVD